MAEENRSSGKSAAERAEAVVGDLARRGELRARDLQRLARTLFERAERNRTELVSLIQKEIQRQVKALGLATRDEVDALRRRVADLEKPAKRARPSTRTSKR